VDKLHDMGGMHGFGAVDASDRDAYAPERPYWESWLAALETWLAEIEVVHQAAPPGATT
jgi:hypothetical protein